MKIKFVKTHEKAVLPICNRIDPLIGDSGHDLVACEDRVIPARGSMIVPIGMKVAYIESGYWFKIESRSGLSFKHSILAHPGIIDSQYRGECGILLYNHSDSDFIVKAGDKIAQFVVYPLIQPEVSFTEEIQETERGDKGFGSSGININN